MRSERGYTLFEILIAVALIGVTSAVAVPVFLSSNALNDLWTSSERAGALVRQTRLKAISQNTTYEVRFNCPSAGEMRGLVLIGDPDIDDAEDRCTNSQVGDSEVVSMESGVSYTTGAATGLRITGRGAFTAVGDAMPLTVAVTSGGSGRYLTISVTGQITFSDSDPTVVADEE